MLTMDQLLVYLVALSSVVLSSALQCDDRYLKTDDYFELTRIDNFYMFKTTVYNGMFKFRIKIKTLFK